MQLTHAILYLHGCRPTGGSADSEHEEGHSPYFWQLTLVVSRPLGTGLETVPCGLRHVRDGVYLMSAIRLDVQTCM